MSIDLHIICKGKLNHRHLGNNIHETGEWHGISDKNADLISRVFLHENQKTRAWHGGEVIAWAPSERDPSRKIFTYRAGYERPICQENWGQEMALVPRNESPE